MLLDDDDIVLEMFEQGHIISVDMYINDTYHIDSDDISIYDDGSGLYCGIND